MRQRAILIAVWMCLALLFLATGHLFMSGVIRYWDDEGYLLLTYNNFRSGGRLYDEVFTQYGPVPYLYHCVAGLCLDGPVTHHFGRALTLAHWTICALLTGGISFLVTRSLVWAVTASLLSFGQLWQFCNEPSHPGSLVCLVLSLGTALILWSYERGRFAAVGGAAGVVGGLLLLTKINVGLMFVAGFGLALLFLTEWTGRWRRAAYLCGASGILAFPWLLMTANVYVTWVFDLAATLSMGLGGFLWLQTSCAGGRLLPGKTWAAGLTGLAATLTLLIGSTLACGSSPAALLKAVLLSPLKQAAQTHLSPQLPPLAMPVALTCLLLAFRVGTELRGTGKVGRFSGACVLILRFGAGVFFLQPENWFTPMDVELGMSTRGLDFFLFLFPAMAPLFCIKLAPGEGRSPWPAFLLAFVALPQVLHAYPVAGSQIGWSSFLLLPLLVHGWCDGVEALSGRKAVPVRCWAVACVPLLAGLGQVILLFQAGRAFQQERKPLGLSGAENLRPVPLQRLEFRLFSLNASIHADVLLTRPGRLSYHAWSGVPPPTSFNTTQWTWLLDGDAHRAIARSLESASRTAIISDSEDHLGDNDPLSLHLNRGYRPLFGRGDGRFLVPKASRAAPFGLAECDLVPVPGTETEKLRIRTNLRVGGVPASARIEEVNSPWRTLAAFDRGRFTISFQKISPEGEVLGPEVELPFVPDPGGLYRVSVTGVLDKGGITFRTNRLAYVFQVLDSAGEVLAEACF